MCLNKFNLNNKFNLKDSLIINCFLNTFFFKPNKLFRNCHVLTKIYNIPTKTPVTTQPATILTSTKQLQLFQYDDKTGLLFMNLVYFVYTI